MDKKALVATKSTVKADADQCMDWDILDFEVDSWGDGCEWYYGNEDSCGDYDTADFDSWDLCCACGGGI